MSKPKHILVIRLSAMGDVAMTVPVLRALTEQHPNIKLTVLTKSHFAPLFRGIPNVNVFAVEIKKEHKGVWGLYKLSKALKKIKIDTIADLHNVLRSNILKCFFFGTKFIQIDKGRAQKKALTKGHIFEPLKTTHQRYADVFEKLGHTIDLSKTTFPAKTAISDPLIQKWFSHQTQTIGIAPFAAFKGKMYPLERMKLVIEGLEKDYKVLLFGGGSHEAKQLDELAQPYQNVKNITQQFDFNSELDIISNLDIMLAMDSGNAHIAAMLGTKVITIWGVTHPYAGFYPFKQDIENAVLADREQFPKIPTSIYGNNLPEGYEKVFDSISPEDIINKVRRLLKKSLTQ